MSKSLEKNSEILTKSGVIFNFHLYTKDKLFDSSYFVTGHIKRDTNVYTDGSESSMLSEHISVPLEEISHSSLSCQKGGRLNICGIFHFNNIKDPKCIV